MDVSFVPATPKEGIMVGDVVSTTLLAAIVTKLVDLARKFDTDNTWPKWIWIVLSIGFGVVIALIWEVNALRELGVESANNLQGRAGQVLTGMLVGGFGSGWHEVFDALSSAAKSARATAASKDLTQEEKRAVWGANIPEPQPASPARPAAP
jgi:hypothetical protein